ncbi:MAG TPA: signal peptidase II, partial [Candidatus Onthousia faecipullorum]|nr:signal peptidase II [Candidatus Onthousia faecipullorum]
ELKSNLDDRILSIGYSLALAGLLGNFLDRLIDGYIIDYLSFKILGYNYPIFNFADILIVVGIVIVIIKEILKERGKKYDVRSK